MDKIRWGILSTGKIAAKFAEGLAVLPDAELVAVGSRTSAAAEAFGARYGISRRHGSYEALAADPDVDVIYIGTPHPLHKENSLLALQHGKAVLCEKPFTLNAAEAAEVIALAREKRLFLMEAMWMRYIPAIVKVRELLAAGAIGEVRLVAADFGFRAEFDPQSRLFAPELGGGALLDVGIYPLSLAYMVLGAPAHVTGLAHLGTTGVDEQSAFLLRYPAGQLAVLYGANRLETPVEATMMGTAGRIRIHSPMHHPTRLTLIRSGHEEELLEVPMIGNGYNYEAAEVMRCLRAGELESPVMPLAETLAIMQTMDQLRAQWGLKYPSE